MKSTLELIAQAYEQHLSYGKLKEDLRSVPNPTDFVKSRFFPFNVLCYLNGTFLVTLMIALRLYIYTSPFLAGVTTLLAIAFYVAKLAVPNILLLNVVILTIMQVVIIFQSIFAHRRQTALRLRTIKNDAEIVAKRIRNIKTKAEVDLFGEQISLIDSCHHQQSETFPASNAAKHAMRFLNVYLLLNNSSKLFSFLGIEKSHAAILAYHYDAIRFISILSTTNEKDCVALAMQRITRECKSTLVHLDWQGTKVKKETICTKNESEFQKFYTVYTFESSSFSSDDYYNALQTKLGFPFDSSGLKNYWYLSGKVFCFTKCEMCLYVFDIKNSYSIFHAAEAEAVKLHASHQVAKKTIA